MIRAKRIVIKPLYENYEVVKERVTSLEKFSQCPYRYMNEPSDKDPSLEFDKDGNPKEDYFYFGHVMHSMMMGYTANPNKVKAMEILTLYPEYFDIVEPYIELVHGLGLDPITVELKLKLEIELGAYLVIIEGTLDMLVAEQDGKKGFIDFKFPKNEWKEENHMGKRQRYLYPFLFGETRGYRDLEYFEYIVMTKHRDRKKRYRPRLQQFRTQIVPEECRQVSFGIIKNFIIAKYKKEFLEKKGYHCFSCSLRDTCKLRN